jgi:coenzyme F420-reducing hydrogenase delta subunit
MLPQFGIEKERLVIDWVSAAEAEKFSRITVEMTEAVKKLGPLGIKKEETHISKEGV